MSSYLSELLGTTFNHRFIFQYFNIFFSLCSLSSLCLSFCASLSFLLCFHFLFFLVFPFHLLNKLLCFLLFSHVFYLSFFSLSLLTCLFSISFLLSFSDTLYLCPSLSLCLYFFSSLYFSMSVCFSISTGLGSVRIRCMNQDPCFLPLSLFFLLSFS